MFKKYFLTYSARNTALIITENRYLCGSKTQDMKTKLLFICLFLAVIGGKDASLFAQNVVVFNEPCGMNPVRKAAEQNNPLLYTQRLQMEHQLQQILQNADRDTWLGDSIVTIPVVFHVLYHNSIENIPDSLIYSQLNVLNEDFARMNADTIILPDYFKPLSGNPKLQFCLATRDPQGNSTNGITRTYTDKLFFRTGGTTSNYELLTEMHFDETGGKNIWNRDHYLNIWVCNLEAQSSVLAWAYLPGADPEVDGIVCRYDYVGRPTIAGFPYQHGRTLTHEVGHWLNLWHTFDNTDNGECSDDFVADTPSQAEANFGCPTFPHSTCGNVSDMYMNYMDYADDNCGKNIFSIGQSTRMRATIALMRPRLLESLGCQGVATNDATVTDVYPNVPYCYANIAPITANIKNLGTAPLTSVIIHHRIDGMEQTPYSWTGNLAPNQEATAILLATPEMFNGLHTLEVYTTMPNGQSDAFPQNDQFRQVFSVGDGIDLPYSQTFDASYIEQGWTIFDSANAVPWQWVQEAIGSDGLLNPSMTIKHDFHDYFNVINSFDDLFMPVINLRTVADATLEFDVSYAYLDDLADRLAVDVSIDCGTTFIEVYNKSGEELSTRTTETPQTADDWRTETVSLNDFVGQNLLVRFRTVTGGGNWLFIDNVSINGTFLGQQSAAPAPSIRLVPNPAKEQLSVVLPSSMPTGTVSVYNMLGQKVLEQEVKNNASLPLRIADLARGVYVLRYATAQKTLVQTWIKE